MGSFMVKLWLFISKFKILVPYLGCPRFGSRSNWTSPYLEWPLKITSRKHLCAFLYQLEEDNAEAESLGQNYCKVYILFFQKIKINYLKLYFYIKHINI